MNIDKKSERKIRKILQNLPNEELIEQCLDLVQMIIDTAFEKDRPNSVNIMGVEFKNE
jgi:hypothetical protein